jgi:predicted permease
MLMVLFGAVTLLLFVACANVANLAISRAVARQAEFTIRWALGASDRRLIRQRLTENVVLAGLGGTVGMLLAWWGTGAVQTAISPGMNLPRTMEITVNARTLGFACVVTVLTGALMWLVSLSRSVQRSTSPAQVTRGVVGHHRRLTSAVIVAEVALALMLLAGTGLVIRTFMELTRVTPGFDASRVLTMKTTLPEGAYASDDRIRAFGAELLRLLESEPHVSRAGFANYLPMSRGGAANRFDIEGRAVTRVDDQLFSWVSIVGGRYFEAMGIPLVSGRLPGRQDSENTEPVFVIDDVLARRYWPNTNPIGARLTWYLANDKTMTGNVIGIVGSVKFLGLAADAPPSAYWWFPQAPAREFALAVRSTTDDAASVATAVTGVIRRIDPNQAVADVRPLAAFVADDLARPRFAMQMLGGFAVVALLLAGMGLYGVVAFWIARRTSEIALRVAIGAQPGHVLWVVMRRTVLLVAGGVAIGLVASMVSANAIAGLLYGVTPADPTTLGLATLFLVLVAMLAAYLPARRALRVDPIIALRGD